ncbi:hypothetical protein [Nostoc sp. C052]|nr:hypothetical protein [Nostoc sp. C052]
MVIAWMTHQRRYQRQAKFIGSAIVSIPLPTCTSLRSHVGESVVGSQTN